MQWLRKLAALGVIMSLVVLVACNNADNTPAPDLPDPDQDQDQVQYPSHDPFVPEYGLFAFIDFPGNYYPEQEPVVDFHEDIDDLFTQYFNLMIAQDPQLFTSRRFPESVVPSQGGKLTPVSFGYQAWQIELAKNTLAVLERYSDADLTKEERVNKDILEWFLTFQVEGEKFLYHDVLNLDNILSLSVFMQLTHPMETVKDAEDYLARLEEFPSVLSQLEANLKIQAEVGYVPPLVILDSAASRVGIYGDALLQDFTTKAEKFDGKENLVSRCKVIITDSVQPAFAKLRAQIQSVRAKAVKNVGELPGGQDYYAWLLKHYTTTDLTPVEVHKICLEEVERLQVEIRQVIDRLGYDSSDYVSVIRELSASTIPEADVIPRYEGLIDMAEGLLPQLFGRIPETPVTIQVNNLRNGYDIPTRDGSLPGVFLISPAWSHSDIGAKWFVWHEAIPGHHLQFAIEHEAEIPYFRDLLFLTGYIEGWGTYGEMLLFEYDLVDDPKSYLSSLNRYLMLAARVVMDTGINYLGWSEQVAGQYFSGVTGQDAAPWIENVVSTPGRSAAYYAGMYKIRELREGAKGELGPAFDIREFHDLVLQYGSMPLAVLEALVEEYIEENK